MFSLALLPMLLSQPAVASDIGTSRKLGAGVGGGTLSSGLTGKMYLQDGLAAQGFVGAGGFALGLGADVVKEFAIESFPEADVFWGAGVGVGTFGYGYVGGGGVFAVSGVAEVGIHLNQLPVEVVLDVRPTFLTGNYVWSGLYLGGGGGAVRYYF